MLRKIEAFALGLGGPGLFLLAFLDSSFLALPEVVDLLLVWMILEHPDRWVWYAGMATAGSIAGCYVIYDLARRGGEVFLRKRLSEHHVTRGMDLFARYGTLALIVPSIAPPPMPFKPFVLMAGVAGMPRARFVGALMIGRGIRYFGEALLTVLYGRAALTYIHQNAARVSIYAGLAILAAGAAYYGYRAAARRR